MKQLNFELSTWKGEKLTCYLFCECFEHTSNASSSSSRVLLANLKFQTKSTGNGQIILYKKSSQRNTIQGSSKKVPVD